MFGFILRRILWAIPTLFFISILSFIIIQLPPGDYLTAYVAQLEEMGETVDQQTIEILRERYGLDEPFYVQYWRWISGIVLRGDFGQSFEYNMPVSELIWDRLALTFMISSLTLIFIWIVAIPIGVYSATHQYSIGDYILTFLGFLGRATPDFLMAIVLLWLAFAYFGADLSGLFSAEFRAEPWSVPKFVDLLGHLWVPIVVLGTSGTAGLIRTLRANTLDELPKPYVDTARAKGVPERRLTWKYPVRVALNPFISDIGQVLPGLVGGAVIVAVVLNLPTTGPLFLDSLLNQDMYLAGSFVLMLSAFTVLGTIVSDVLLAWVDPRIRLE